MRMIGSTAVHVPLTCRDGATGGVDVHGDILLLVHRVEVQKLSDEQVCHVIVDSATQAHDPLRMGTYEPRWDRDPCRTTNYCL